MRGRSQPADSVVSTILVDHDPISRYVLGRMLDECAQVNVMARISGEQSVESAAALGPDLAVLAPSSLEDLSALAAPLIARRIKVLALGVRWTRAKVEEAIGAGINGCLVKDAETLRLASAVLAVAAGHAVLTPELAGMRDGGPASAARARSAELGERLRKLTEREREVLHLLAQSRSTADTAAELGVSPATVKSHVSHALSKIGARSRLEAILMIRGEYGDWGRGAPPQPAAARGPARARPSRLTCLLLGES